MIAQLLTSKKSPIYVRLLDRSAHDVGELPEIQNRNRSVKAAED